MSNVRAAVASLGALGPLPSEEHLDAERVKRIENLYKSIARPITDDEARVLVSTFGNDDCFGLASSIMHLVETAPGWPLEDCLQNVSNIWIAELRNRAIRGGYLV